MKSEPKKYDKKPLTDAEIKSFKPKEKPYKKSDSLGLYLLIHPNGSKYWRLKYKIYGKEKVYAIGKYPLVGLSDARRARYEAKKLINDGIDPTDARKSEYKRLEQIHSNTFEKVALRWHEKMAQTKWKESNAKDILRVMKRDLLPFLGKMPVQKITPLRLEKVLQKIEKRGALELLRKQRQRCFQIFKFAIKEGLCEINPAATLEFPRATKKYFNCIDIEELPKLLKDINNFEGDVVIKYAIQLIMLTALRTEEHRHMQWSWIDFDDETLTVPANRLKWWRKFKDPKRVHIVPLPKQAIKILRQLQEINGQYKHVFASPIKPQQCISNNAMLYNLYRMGYHNRHTIHAMRSLFSTLCNTKGFNKDHIESALTHTVDDTRHDYNKSIYLPQRRRIMRWYADKLDNLTKEPEIIPINRVNKKTS